MIKTSARNLWLALALVLGLAVAASAQAPATTSGGSGQALLNLQDDMVALHGYDPVAYFNHKLPVKGSKRFYEIIGGATYYFASRDDKIEFMRDAPHYQPQFGGYCATSMASGHVVDVDPSLFAVYEGRLYLFNSPEAQTVFLNEPRRIIAEATRNYFKLASKKRSTY